MPRFLQEWRDVLTCLKLDGGSRVSYGLILEELLQLGLQDGLKLRVEPIGEKNRPGVRVTWAKQTPGQWLESFRQQTQRLAVSTQLIEDGLELTTDPQLRIFDTPLDAGGCLDVLYELKQRRRESAELNREIEETNRGVVALYAELEAKAESVRQSAEMKQRFLSNITHEFRTPLKSIVNLSSMLLDRFDGDLTSEQEKQVSLIQHAGDTLLGLVNDLLDLAKAESGKLTVYYTLVSLRSVLASLKGLMRPLQAQQSEVELLIEEPQQDLKWETDDGKLTQILRNLISNALKFTERGEVRLTVEHDAEMVRFSVSDTGIGIARENLERIFEEFIQIENHLQKRAKGTGLGLSLSQRLAQMLGGYLTVSSVLGQGSRFTLYLPRDPTQRLALPESGIAEVDTEELEPEGEPLAANRVLLAEDNEAYRYWLANLLRQRFDEVLEAPDGQEAWQLLQREPVDLVVLDLQMPRMTGWEVMDALKSHPQLRKVPIVINSAESQYSVPSEIAESFAPVFLEKMEMGDSQAAHLALDHALRQLQKARTASTPEC
ncbi:MAG: ATP-binding protein [Verrucomicrobiota bacterium JB022]|nr:ATP-binding protein [Verrucomicrobiota bacterium JB022]